MTQDFYHIKFSAEGKDFKAKVFVGYEEDGGAYYRIHVEGFAPPLFLQMNKTPDQPVWKIKEGDMVQLEVSEEFVYQLGNAIESHED